MLLSIQNYNCCRYECVGGRRFNMIKRIAKVIALGGLLTVLFAACATTSASKDMGAKDDGAKMEKEMASDEQTMKDDNMKSEENMEKKDDAMTEEKK